eukprot:2258439-Alexandrium_andersonii.AAC.1
MAERPPAMISSSMRLKSSNCEECGERAAGSRHPRAACRRSPRPGWGRSRGDRRCSRRAGMRSIGGPSAPGGAPCGTRRTASRATGTRGCAPVSYTHLTLPTICSV